METLGETKKYLRTANYISNVRAVCYEFINLLDAWLKVLMTFLQRLKEHKPFPSKINFILLSV